MTGGTLYTSECAKQLSRPLLVVALEELPGLDEVIAWIDRNEISVLNIAGPRASQAPGLYDAAVQFLLSLVRYG